MRPAMVNNVVESNMIVQTGNRTLAGKVSCQVGNTCIKIGRHTGKRREVTAASGAFIHAIAPTIFIKLTTFTDVTESLAWTDHHQ